MAKDKRRMAVVTADRKAAGADVTASRDHHSHASKKMDNEEVVPFRFFALPSELRLRIYEEALRVHEPIDLDDQNYRRILPRLSMFLVNHQMHEEAYRVFYSQTIRLFPKQGRFFLTTKPLLSRLPTRYRRAIYSMELRIGPGWSAPPRGQKITPELGLAECTSLRSLHIFVEIDPSETFFAGFRGKDANEDTYKNFCLDLLTGIYERVPSLKTVEIDAHSGIRQDGPMIMALQRQVRQHGIALTWGPLSGWTKCIDEPVSHAGFEQLMATLDISDSPRLVEVSA